MKRKRINIKIIVFTIMMLCTIVMPCFSRQAFAVGTASDIINEAKKHLGKPYVKGGNGPNVFDCSGFTKYVFGQVGYNLSRTTYTQINEGQAISRSELKPGDLVFERGTAAVPEHVGIYIGNGQIIHAANPDDGVKIGSIYEYVAARRIIKDTPVAPPAPINPYESIDKVIFDADFYADKYPELKAGLGNNYNVLYNHWQEHGKKEGRAPSAVFDPNYYAVNNSDVKATYGNNWQAVYEHFVIDGYKQNRKSSPVFDMEFYKNANPDLKGLGSDLGFLEHFIKHGMNEGRQASKNFDPKAYAERYSDLKNEYGTNYKLYFNQYLLSGLNEGRSGKAINPYESIDKVIFDADFYAQRNQDLKWLGNDYNALYEHWQEHGKKEGRAPSAIFDPTYYIDNNSDVKAAYGNNYQAAYENFVIGGYKQNRKSSPVFDMEFYKNANPDLKGLGSDLGFLEHFIKHGMNEGRQASKNFDPKAYAERYSDLKNEYGTNYKLYFNHYLISGLNEGRSGKAINPYESIDKVIFDADFYAQRNQDLKWLGNDYNALYEHWQEHGKKEGRAPSAVFDPTYYIDNNSDVKAAYGNNYQAAYENFVIGGYKQNRKSSPVFDMEFYKNANPDLKGLGSDLGFLEHFIKHGMNEGRQASKNFDPKAYAERYSDLKNEYGTNYKLYFNHYLISGLKEGRNGRP